MLTAILFLALIPSISSQNCGAYRLPIDVCSSKRIFWPRGEIPYYNDLKNRRFRTEQSMIGTAMSVISQATAPEHTKIRNSTNCVNFLQISYNERVKYPVYLRIKILSREKTEKPKGVHHYPHCYTTAISYKKANGRMALGERLLELDYACFEHFGLVVRAMMNAIGFSGDQLRPDRDEFITYHFERLPPARREYFAKNKSKLSGFRHRPLSILPQNSTSPTTPPSSLTISIRSCTSAPGNLQSEPDLISNPSRPRTPPSTLARWASSLA